MADAQKFTDVAGAALRQSCGKTKIYELIGNGSLRAYKLGRRTLIDLDDLDECFERTLMPLQPARAARPGKTITT